MSPGAVRLGQAAVVADLVLAAILTAFLFAVTSSRLDAVPRPLALLALFATPGVIGAIGVAGRRRSLLAAAAIVLVPASLLSMAGVTLVFVLPMVLFAAAAASDPRAPTVGGVAETVGVAALVVGAGVALFGLSGSGCSASGDVCGSGFITVAGFGLEVILLAAAIVVAAWRAGLHGLAGRRRP